ncbi:hypothetical protein COEREDRAFT_82629 [Coemansia reversa NRRL 1564]|uniref:Ribosomal protein bL31m N-terminal domain-containing protein n=1 Tax=Coemansia reversa (strain ATCC 12441 / NRRL 1564) TaxID=763665 RepID=A0A2G5B6G3_COERN|nr:hypothetical protein COEREDRAFT_82629 [Coemansia reversa NRRL 1564]|eukprot:PIA14599.1 hypothetical protein COEREDRAFT_82629 [Coemansia reversa NRRL 1564]
MRQTLQLLKAQKSLLAREWKPRAAEVKLQTINTGARHPELFTSQIILSDGSSFRVRSTAPRAQVKITKDTRSHMLWNPQAKRKIDDEGGYLSSFQKKFEGLSTNIMDFNFDTPAQSQSVNNDKDAEDQKQKSGKK